MNKVISVFILFLVGCASNHQDSKATEKLGNIEIHVQKDSLALGVFNFECLFALQKALDRVNRTIPVTVSVSESFLEYEAVKVTSSLREQGFQKVELITGKAGWTLYPPTSKNEELESCKP